MTHKAWHEEAACAGLLTEAFYPPTPREPKSRATRRKAVTAALRVCLACPVRRQCAADALANGERYGIWGGVDLGDQVSSKSTLAKRYEQLRQVSA
ncbi:WhiB family transcriptional regulator [Nocardia sp. NPDC004711]